jgi:hypothetical protein
MYGEVEFHDIFRPAHIHTDDFDEEGGHPGHIRLHWNAQGGQWE